jgi:hypothetical protein
MACSTFVFTNDESGGTANDDFRLRKNGDGGGTGSKITRSVRLILTIHLWLTDWQSAIELQVSQSFRLSGLIFEQSLMSVSISFASSKNSAWKTIDSPAPALSMLLQKGSGFFELSAKQLETLQGKIIFFENKTN